MKVHFCVQISDDWWDLRRGVPTASEFSRIITAKGKRCALAFDHAEPHALPAVKGAKNLKSEERCRVFLPTLSSGVQGYISQLIADRASLEPNYFSSDGVSRPMENGRRMEAEARRFYELERGTDVLQVGFIKTDDGRFGASPDGIILGDCGPPIVLPDGRTVYAAGGLELKCVERHTLVNWWLDGEQVPLAHKQQVHGGLAVTGLAFWDFLAYSPGVKPLLVRTYPDEYTAALNGTLEIFWGRYQSAIETVIGRKEWLHGL